MTNADTVTELRFEPPAPGYWERDAVHFPRPMTRYWQEVHPAAFARGTGDFARFYGMLMGSLGSAYVHGFGYRSMVPVAEEEVPARFQRASEVMQGKLWREQLRDWDERVKPDSIKAHRAVQSVDPAGLSDQELVEYLTRCRDHHAAMIAQHMRYTASAVVPTGDFLAHVGDWTDVPPAELLGLMRGTAPVSAGASAELERLIAAFEADARARELLASDDDPGQVLAALRALDGEAGEAVSGYLELVGYRLLDGFDISEPYALSMPDALVRAIQIAVAGTRPRGRRRRGGGRRHPRQGARAASGRVRRAARRGTADLPAARRARRLQRHLGLRPDAPGGARGQGAASQSGGRSTNRCT